MLYAIGKEFSRSFQRYITSPQTPSILVGTPKRQLCSRSTTAQHAGQNKPQWENDCDSFYHSFLLVKPPTPEPSNVQGTLSD